MKRSHCFVIFMAAVAAAAASMGALANRALVQQEKRQTAQMCSAEFMGRYFPPDAYPSARVRWGPGGVVMEDLYALVDQIPGRQQQLLRDWTGADGQIVRAASIRRQQAIDSRSVLFDSLRRTGALRHCTDEEQAAEYVTQMIAEYILMGYRTMPTDGGTPRSVQECRLDSLVRGVLLIVNGQLVHEEAFQCPH